MKKIFFSVFVCLTFLCMKCKDEIEPIDLLPSATQTGKNTFGCLINGEPFTPDELASSLSVQYSSNDEKYFYLSAIRNTDNIIVSPAFGVVNLPIVEGKRYNLSIKEEDDAYGLLYIKSEFIYTYKNYGELFISKHDTERRIISGTFWFNARSRTAALYRITEGRFDIKY